MADENDPSKARRTYLIAYSEADIEAFSTRKSFANVVKEAFTSSSGKSQPLHFIGPAQGKTMQIDVSNTMWHLN